jgi:glycosyltransferase involved in cell wall biosynthesis
VLLSVVIPTLNGAAHLPAQLEAVAGQVCTADLEVVVADNGSTDSTAAVVSGFGGVLPRLQLVSVSQRGKSYALNAGIDASSGKLIACIDQDDVIAPGYLEAMRTALESTDLAGARIEHQLLNPPWAVVSRTQDSSLPVFPAPTRRVFSSGGAVAFHRNVYEKVGGFAHDVETGDDVDFAWRAQMAGFSLTFVPDAVVHIRHRRGLSATFQQGLGYGRGAALVRQKFGLNRIPWDDYRWRVRAVASHLVHFNDPWRRYRFALLAGFVLGAATVERRLLSPRRARGYN